MTLATSTQTYQSTSTRPAHDTAAATTEPTSSHLVRSTAWGLGGGVVAGMAGLGLTIVVSRTLPRDQAGVFFSCVAMFMVASTISLLGTDTGLLRTLAALRTSGRVDAVQRALQLGLTRPLLVAATVAVTGWALSDEIAKRLAPAAVHTPAITAVAVMAVAVVMGCTYLALVNGAIRGLGNVRTFMLINQIWLPLSRLVAIPLLVLVSGAPLLAALTGWLVPMMIATGWAIWHVRRQVQSLPNHVSKDDPAAPPFDVDELLARYWPTTWPRGVAASFEIIIVWADVVIVTAVLGPTVGGAYAALSRFVTSGMVALQAIRLSTSPQLARAFAHQEWGRAADIHRMNVRAAIALSWPIYLALAIFAPGVCALVGLDDPHLVWVLAILCTGMCVVATTGNANTVLNMAHRSHWAAANTGGAALLMVVLDLLLVPRLGVMGAAIGWASAMVTDAALSTWRVRRGLGLRSLDRQAALVMLVAGLGFGGIALAIRMLGDAGQQTPMVTLLLGSIVAGLGYLVLVWHWRTSLGLAGLGKQRSAEPRPGGPP